MGDVIWLVDLQDFLPKFFGIAHPAFSFFGGELLKLLVGEAWTMA